MKKQPLACGILLLTHGRQGEALVESVTHLLGKVPDNVIAVSLFGTERRIEIERRCEQVIGKLRAQTNGILLLSDLFGSTQGNMAGKISLLDDELLCVHGVNLAMALEAVSMCHLPLADLQKRVADVGRQSIIEERGRHG